MHVALSPWAAAQRPARNLITGVTVMGEKKLGALQKPEKISANRRSPVPLCKGEKTPPVDKDVGSQSPWLAGGGP
jgi:hypothetical protein